MCEQTAGFQSLNRLVQRRHYEDLSNSHSSNTLNGKVIYQVFAHVVDYAPYYQGVREIVTKDNEALGHVTIPDDQPLALQDSCCNPIALDNFLQVAGIHVNCLTERCEGQVLICTELGELFLTEAFLKSRQDMRSWTLYSTFERKAGNCLVNDIFARDPKTGNLVAMFMGATFRSVPIASLAKTLAAMNGNSKPAEDRKRKQIEATSSPMENGTYSKPGATGSRGAAKDSTIARGADNSQHGQQDVQEVRAMLSDILEVPMQEIQPHSTFTDLAIDSLISTEILSECKKRFGVAVSIADFKAMNDVQSLARQFQPSGHHLHGQTAEEPHTIPNGLLTPQTDAPSLIEQVQQMFGNILAIPASEVKPEARLADLGIDSLMVTETLGEIRKYFNVVVTTTEFQKLQDVRSLAEHLQARLSKSPAAEQSSEYTGDMRTDRGIATTAHASFRNVQRNFDAITRQTQFSGFFQSVYPAQMELVLAYVVEAFTSLGCPLASLRSGELLPDIPILGKYEKLKNQLYRILADHRLVERDLTTGRFARTSGPVPQSRADVLRDAIVSKFPQHASEHKLLTSTGSKLADCLTGRADPLAILFGDPQARS